MTLKHERTFKNRLSCSRHLNQAVLKDSPKLSKHNPQILFLLVTIRLETPNRDILQIHEGQSIIKLGLLWFLLNFN